MHSLKRLNSRCHSLLLRAFSAINFMFKSNKYLMATFFGDSFFGFPWIFIVLFSTFPAIWEQSLLLSSPWSRRRKRGSGWIALSLWSHRSPNWTGHSYLFSWNWFFHREHFCINITMIVTEPAVQDVLLLGLGFCILATCRSHSTSFFIPPRSHAFNSVRLSCARKKGIGVENEPIYEVFLEYDKIKQAKETLCSQGAIPGKLFTTIRNIVEAVIC